MILCGWDAPEGHPGLRCVHLHAFVSYRRLSSQFQFSLSAVTLGYLSQWARMMSLRIVKCQKSPSTGERLNTLF
jgi:hypothetical protein